MPFYDFIKIYSLRAFGTRPPSKDDRGLGNALQSPSCLHAVSNWYAYDLSSSFPDDMLIIANISALGSLFDQKLRVSVYADPEVPVTPSFAPQQTPPAPWDYAFDEIAYLVS